MSLIDPRQFLGQNDGRTEPKMLVDTPEGNYRIPVTVLADFQFEELVRRVVAEVTEAIWAQAGDMDTDLPDAVS